MKLNTKKIAAVTGFATCLVLPWSAQGAWSLMADFEDLAPGTYIKDGTPDLVYPIAQNGGQGQMEIYADVPGAGGNNCAWFWYGTVNANAGSTWHFIPLNHEIQVGETGTVFYRIMIPQTDTAYHVGLTPIAPEDQVSGAGELWNNMTQVIRYNATADPLRLDAHNGTSYSNSFPLWYPEPGVWYSYWLVIDNSWDTSGENPVLTGGWWMYRQSDTETEPTLMFWGDETTNFSLMGFRNKSVASIKAFWMCQGNYGGSSNPWFIDDIWQADGECTKVPPEECVSGPATWCGYTIAAGDYVDTGSWMEWIYVGLCPSGAPGWVYSVNLNAWIYVAGCPDAGGSWVYVPN